MRYPYYNPNLTFSVVIKALFLQSGKAEKIIKEYFANLTGKKYILITNSCRSALFLAYRAIEKKGEVVTSPLTCKVAIDPIEESSNKPVFADVNTGDLNMNTDDIEPRLTNDSIAIQAIHMGGVACNMDKINSIAKKHNLWVIEDCAQSLGAKYKGKNTGSFGDIACFSLIKNAYGIGGGILATNSKEIYHYASTRNQTFNKTPKKLTLFRLIRNITETYQKNFFVKLTYKLLLKIKGGKTNYKSIYKQLRHISKIELKISTIQISRFKNLHQKRKKIGKTYYQKLYSKNFLINYNYDPNASSYTKFFIYNPEIKTKETLDRLHKKGIEAMHLEHKHGSPYQEKVISDRKILSGLTNYCEIHDNLVSLPISEKYDENDIKNIIKILINND